MWCWKHYHLTLCGAENIQHWSVLAYLLTFYVIKISIISKIILFYYKRHTFNPWSVYVWNRVIHSLNCYCKVMVNANMDPCWRLYWISFRVGEYLVYFKALIFLWFLFITETNTCVPPGFNWMTRLVFFNNLNHKFRNYQFCVFENDPLGFFTLLVDQLLLDFYVSKLMN